MLVLPSHVKARIGKALYLAVRAGRSLVSDGSPTVICTRAGICWELELREAIELSIYVFGAFEPRLRRVFDRVLRPGMVTIDVGANVGSHALYMAKLVGARGRVFAFEPTTFAFEKLTRNLELNPWASEIVDPVRSFVSESGSKVPPEIHSSWDLERLRDGHPDHGGLLMETAGATSVSIDEFVAARGLTRVDFIKIDVDGFEVPAAKGATDTLRRLGPTVLLEVCHYTQEEHGHTLEELLNVFHEAGYGFLDLALRPLRGTPKEIARSIPRNAVMNVVARPRS